MDKIAVLIPCYNLNFPKNRHSINWHSLGKLKKARTIKEIPIFHLYFLEKYGIIQEKQLTLKH